MNFKDLLIQKYQLTTQDWEITTAYFNPVKIPAREYFLKRGEIADRLAIIQSGMFRTYSFDDKGDEITINFNEQGSVLISAESFNNQEPANENIVAIDDAELIIMTYKGMKELYDKVPVWQQICKDVAEMKNEKLTRRITEFQTQSATERYKRFCKEHHEVYKKAAIGQIASYLGIDIATLSRIRKKSLV